MDSLIVNLTCAPVQDLVSRVSMYLQAYTLYSSVRPFGVSAIFGAVDRSGPQLYMIEPSGLSFGHRATAVGKGKLLAKTELEKLDLAEGIETRDAVMHAARMFVSPRLPSLLSPFSPDLTSSRD